MFSTPAITIPINVEVDRPDLKLNLTPNISGLSRFNALRSSSAYSHKGTTHTDLS